MTTETTKYNGWTNYATWRINLELFDGYEIEQEVDHEEVEQLAEEFIFSLSTGDTNIMEDYARAFIADVNWYEIAEALNEQLEEA